jgi:8-amino-7-oxononanoate synthase
MVMQSPPGAETVIDGRKYLYFVGTGYLGLQGDPEVIRAACEAARQFGLGSATSRAGFGDTPPTLDVEHQAARFARTEAAFCFASGYVGNQLLVSSLVGEADALFLDACAHYSIVDASRGAGLPVFRFPHADAEGLREALKQHLRRGQRPVVFSDGVFAALGTIAPVADYCDVFRHYPGAVLCLDDAHAFGVLGARGRGTFEHVGLGDGAVNTLAREGDNPKETLRLFSTATLSKAFGAYGGIICGSQAYIDHVKASSHYYDGASAPPVPAAAAGARALQMVAEDPRIVEKLRENALTLKRGLRNLGLQVDLSPVPICCLTIGSAENMQRIQQTLMQQDIMIAYKGSYSGLGSAGALRIAVFATHSDTMIETLVDAIGRTL